MAFDGMEILYSGAMLVVAAAILLFARVFFSRLTSLDVDRQLVVADNPAVGTALFGYMAGVVIAMAGILSTARHGDAVSALSWDLFETTLYGIVSVVLLRLAGVVNDRFILHNCENKKELVTDRNVGVGALLCGSYVASGLVLAGAFSGRLWTLDQGLSRWAVLGIELAVACGFFVAAQVVLAIYGQIYQRTSKHDPLVAIEKNYTVNGVSHGGNAAAGMAMGGNLIAVGVILWGASRGDVHDWSETAVRFGGVVGIGLVLLVLWRLAVVKVFLGKLDMSREIFVDRNPNAALLESVALVGFAVALALVLGGPDDPVQAAAAVTGAVAK